MVNIKYLVKLNIEKAVNAGFCYSACGPVFKATLENTSSRNFYFTLEDSKALVVIPHDWVEWMAPAPIVEHTEEEKEKTEEEKEDINE